MSLLKRLGATPPAESIPVSTPISPSALADSAAPPSGSIMGSRVAAAPPPPPEATPRDQRMPAAPGASGDAVGKQKILELSLWIVDRIQGSLNNQTELTRSPETERLIQERFTNYYRQSGVNLVEEQIKQLYTMVGDELLGFGPIEPLLRDESITEIMVNSPHTVYVEQRGKITLSSVKFASDDHVMKVIDRIIRPLGRRIDRKWPMVDARLPDGSRVNAIIPPCAIDGPSITIRKFSKKKLQIEDLIGYGSVTPQMAEFLKACVVSRLNVVVSGGTGSGKTTLLNVLSGFIPSDERILTIEDSAELKLNQEHVLRIEAKPPEVDGTGRVSINDLVINSLRMRPDRIVIGECRGGETMAMLQAMNTGHDGSLTTLHSNTPRDAIARMETMALMSGMDMPIRVIREQIASAVNLIVQQTRLDDGKRKVSYITEVQGMEGDVVVLQDIFMLEIKGKTPDGQVIADLKPTGTRPRFTSQLEAHGFKLPADIFGAVAPGKKGW